MLPDDNNDIDEFVTRTKEGTKAVTIAVTFLLYLCGLISALGILYFIK